MNRPKRRSLLVASVGIATVSYVLAACGKDQHPISGNLPAPDPTPSVTPVTGNLTAPPPMDAAPTPMDAAPTATAPPITGNQTAPPHTAMPPASPSAKPTPKK
jgi:hypothetical protein